MLISFEGGSNPFDIPCAITSPINSCEHWYATRQVTIIYIQPPATMTAAPVTPSRVPNTARLARELMAPPPPLLLLGSAAVPSAAAP